MTSDASAGPGAERARARYEAINATVARQRDFARPDLERSWTLFDLVASPLRTRTFDVVTCVAGLPVPPMLRRAFAARLDELIGILPTGVRVYRVDPRRLHWEAHIVKRPDEPSVPLPSEDVAASFRDAVTGARPFELRYRGLFISAEGAVCFQGLGETDELRERLRAGLPFSSPDQLVTAHISAARILDPIGEAAFTRLVELRRRSEEEDYGVLPVETLKLVAEHRWYLERYTVLAEAQLVG